MIKNYIKIAFRNLKNNKVDSSISIGGLAIGIACCLLLITFVRFEWSFDEFHKKGDRIFMVYSSYENSNTGEISKNSPTPYPLASFLESNVPEFEQVIRYRSEGAEVKIENQYILQRNIVQAEPEFLQMFSFPLIKGNPKTALDSPNKIVLTQHKARQIFGTRDVIGKTVTLKGRGKEELFTVTGVLENIPSTSSFDFEYILPFENNLMRMREDMRQNWFVAGSETYVMLNENVDAVEVEKKLQQNLGDAVPEAYRERNTMHLLSLQEMYLSPELSSHSRKSSNPLYSWILACVAFVVLIIAAINFMSLTLSRASRRSGEISIRKVVGAARDDLGVQFIGEAFLICLIAFVLGGVVAELAMPWFSALIDKPLSLNLLNTPVSWAVVFLLLVMATLITGVYPAWVLARQKIVTGLVSRTTSGKTPVVVKGLVVVQFALAITFLSSAYIMYSQMSFISTKDLGFNPENLVDIEMSLTNPEKGAKIFNTYSRQAMQLSGVQSVTSIYGQLGNSSMSTSLVTDSLRTSVNVEIIDEHFIETMQIDLIEGRSFTEERPSDFKNGVLLNREAVEMFGWQNPIEKKIRQSKYKTFLDGKEVIGVVENYHYRPLYYQVKPLIFVHRSVEGYGTVYMRTRIAENRTAKTINKLKSIWQEMDLAQPFNYSFVNNLVDQQYENQQRWKNIIQLASVVAIAIACFGLFGLISLAAQRRIKEIGIRKVFGATVSNIVTLLSKDFLKLVALGFVIAVPIAWYAMHQWLADFAYRIEIRVGVFLIAGGAAFLIALLTVSWQSARAALANPAESLRSE